ncbi:MAG: serine protease [Candidatus Portnoybacteria bacterium]|nr:serine protease [Candidatus Portnoybacteria bacterium]
MKKHDDYKKIIGFWLLVFLVGGLGGLFFVKGFFPWLAGITPFDKIGWLSDFKDGTTIINKTEKVYLAQDAAYQEAIARVSGAVVAVRLERNGRIIAENSGFILTNDGLVVTADLISKGTKAIVIKDAKEYEAQVIKQDKDDNLALLRISEANLSVVSFGEINNLKIGEMVFLAGANQNEEVFGISADIGFVKTLAPRVSFSLNGSYFSHGGPVANNKGEVLGLALVEKDGSTELVAAEKIKEIMK